MTAINRSYGFADLCRWIEWTVEHVRIHLRRGELRKAIAHAKQMRDFKARDASYQGCSEDCI